jgi:hypothetical protein
MNEANQNPENRIALFQRKEIRRTIHNGEWWFVITDVIAALTDSVNPKGYFTDMRRREPELADALKGGGNLPPLGPALSNGRWAPVIAMLEHRRHFPLDTVHTEPESRAIQALVGARRLRTHSRD